MSGVSSRFNTLKVFAGDIKLAHSVFALPFVAVAFSMTGIAGLSFPQIGKIIVCMVLARSFAMGMNRYLDRDLDADNQRTKSRALPSGATSVAAYLAITLICGVAFIAASFSLSRLAGFLSPFLLIVLGFYSMMKRVSWLTHWYLGACLGLAPVAAEIAIFDRVSAPIVLVGVAVMFWTAGFDLLYSLQDREFDQSYGLHSVPARLGHKVALWLSRLSFAGMIAVLLVAGNMVQAGAWWRLGVGVVAVILVYEHWLVRDAMTTGTSSRINLAFFNLNALVSVLFCVFAIVDAYVKNI